MIEQENKGGVFDNLDNLRLSPNNPAGAAKEILTHVPLAKPSRQEFFRTHPDPDRHLTTAIIFDDEHFGRDAYLVLPAMRDELAGDVRVVHLVPIITRQGVFKLWPLKLPADETRTNPWFDTARQAVELSKTHWVCVKPDLALGAYRVLQAVGDIPDPVWPDRPINELLELAFRGRVIDSPDHPMVRRLLGAA